MSQQFTSPNAYLASRRNHAVAQSVPIERDEQPQETPPPQPQETPPPQPQPQPQLQAVPNNITPFRPRAFFAFPPFAKWLLWVAIVIACTAMVAYILSQIDEEDTSSASRPSGDRHKDAQGHGTNDRRKRYDPDADDDDDDDDDDRPRGRRGKQSRGSAPAAVPPIIVNVPGVPGTQSSAAPQGQQGGQS